MCSSDLQEKKLGNDGIGNVIVDWRTDEHDSVTKQATVNVPCPFLTAFAFIDVWKW